MKQFVAVGVQIARIGANQDIDEGLHWLCLAAYQNDPHAQLSLGTYLSEGPDARRNIEAAAYWYRLAAQQGDAIARASLKSLLGAGKASQPSRCAFPMNKPPIKILSNAKARAFIMSEHKLPDPTTLHPLVLPGGVVDKATILLNQAISHANIEIGDWTYYNDRTMPEDYAGTIAPYLYEGAREKLVIGRFCQIAQGVQFVTSTANHPMGGVSTYPFAMFDLPQIARYLTQLDPAKDTVIGNDCWIGREAALMPGTTLGNGVIVGSRAVVTGTVPDYAIVAGNPAKVVRVRYDDETVKRLLEIAWWDWSKEKIEAAIPAIEAGDIDALEAMK